MSYQDWTQADTAKEWDRRDPAYHPSNPTRAEQLDILLSILEDHYHKGQTILDLGSGNGFVEELLFQRIPSAQIVGVDFSAEMIALALGRLKDHIQQFRAIRHDLSDLSAIELPQRDYALAFSVQALHHLSAEAMQSAFGWVYQTLAPDGLFLLQDRVAVSQEALWSVYQSLWKRQEKVYEAQARQNERYSFEEHTSHLAERGDRPQAPRQVTQWLVEAGFTAEVIHLHGNRALIAARK